MERRNLNTFTFSSDINCARVIENKTRADILAVMSEEHFDGVEFDIIRLVHGKFCVRSTVKPYLFLV